MEGQASKWKYRIPLAEGTLYLGLEPPDEEVEEEVVRQTQPIRHRLLEIDQHIVGFLLYSISTMVTKFYFSISTVLALPLVHNDMDFLRLPTLYILFID